LKINQTFFRRHPGRSEAKSRDPGAVRPDSADVALGPGSALQAVRDGELFLIDI